MTRDEQKAEARRLHDDEVLTYATIASRLGVDRSMVWKWLNPVANSTHEKNRNASKRAWERAHRASCTRCGAPHGPGTARADGSRRDVGDLCAGCLTSGRAERALEMWRLRAEFGCLNGEIAERLGASVHTVEAELYRLRAIGFDIPRSPYVPSAARKQRDSATLVGGKEAATLAQALAARGITPDDPPAWSRQPRAVA